MKITRDNYESWFLDYLEGHLEEGMVNEFIEFIHQNSDLKDELLLYEPVRLEHGILSYDGKERLYKELLDLPSEFENAAVARLEGDQTPEEVLAFEEYLSRHPGKKAEADLFSQTKLHPDLSVVFAPRGKIYKQTPVRIMLSWSMRIAAVLLLSWIIYNSAKWSDNSAETNNSFSENNIQSGKEGLNNKENLAVIPEKSLENVPRELTQNQLSDKKSRAATNKAAGNKPKLVALAVNPVRLPSGGITTENPAGISGNEKDIVSTLRKSVQVPGLLSALPCRVFQKPEEMTFACLSPNQVKTEIISSEKLSFKERILDKTHIPEMTFNKILRGGLNLAMNLSNDKFKFRTNKEGEIIAYNLDTRLLGLSIPVKR
jgi:hypothetical protein